MTPRVPTLDEQLRRRLGRRFGSAIELWLDQLPLVLTGLAAAWDIELDGLIQGGSMSVVIRCRAADGRRAVLKISPDRQRVVDEAAALAAWRTEHVPAVLAVDANVGALLMEAIEPGTTLAESGTSPRAETLALLMTSLHDHAHDSSHRPLADRIDQLFESGLKNYDRRPDLAAVVPPELYEQGRRRALDMAARPCETVLLHGDLTPVNVLDGGEARGLVAIDPAACSGDPAFDAVDLVLWRAQDLQTIVMRAEQLGSAMGVEAERLVQWCAAFAAMTALEIAEAADDADPRVDLMLSLADVET